MRRYLRKGISTLIATVLLILIAISTGLLIYAFATGWIGSRTSIGVGPSSSITIEMASITKINNNDGVNVTVYVRNIGGVPTNVSAIYVTDLSSGDVYANLSPKAITDTDSSNNTIPPGYVKGFSATINRGLSLVSGHSYEIKVVTSDGASATYTVTYRGS